MLSDAIYIDTRPGQDSAFSPSESVEDYGAWLLERYNSSRIKQASGKYYYFGLGQKINEIINRPALVLQKQIEGAHIVELKVMAHGPYAGQAASVIEKLSLNTVVVEVLG